jgi:hypothetical protein
VAPHTSEDLREEGEDDGPAQGKGRRERLWGSTAGNTFEKNEFVGNTVDFC